jgi:co-chaperonin GroES (HSP10)
METFNGKILPSKILIREIKPEVVEKKTSTGIIIPELNKRNPQTSGEVVLVGDSVIAQTTPIRVGDTVLFTPLAGQKFFIEDSEMILLEASSILYVIPK